MKKSSQIINGLNIEEKASLLAQAVWETQQLPDPELANFMWVDGPAGVRKMKDYFDEDIYNTVPCTSYPSPSTYASSWDRELVRQIGRHLGRETRAQKADGLLAPGVNLKRSPLGGRNFEYYSEDPYVTAELATEFIKGLQGEGTGACIKHYAVNNQETRRMSIDVRVDEAVLRELYLKAFEKPIKEGRPDMVMAAYNQVNGEYCAESSHLIGDILRKEWGYEGVVVTDCFAAHDLAKGIKHGLNLQMPGEKKERLAERVKEFLVRSQITEVELDAAIDKNIRLAEKFTQNRLKITYDQEAHHAFAGKVAVESMVLLKNQHDILPCQSSEGIAVIGEMAVKPRFQGGGSSHVNPWKLEPALDCLNELGSITGYAAGYQEDRTSAALIREAVELAQRSEKVLLFLGLPEIYESEGYDRTHLSIPQAHIDLLDAIQQVNPELVVVLFNGAPVEMPWLHKVKAVLEAYLPGEAGGRAIAAIIYGKENPCGRLAETFPMSLRDTPCYLHFPGGKTQVNYVEKWMVGYRYYDKADRPVLFPFGHGLSYTTFHYSDFQIQLSSGKRAEVKLKITNTGNRDGKEVVQVYVGKAVVEYERPVKELAGFQKVGVPCGETVEVSLLLDQNVFQRYDETAAKWMTEAGDYQICIGKSVAEIVYRENLSVNGEGEYEAAVTEDTCLGDLIGNNRQREILEEALKEHPRSMEFLKLSQEENPLRASMGGLMSFQNLKRTDDSLKDEDIVRIISMLNKD